MVDFQSSRRMHRRNGGDNVSANGESNHFLSRAMWLRETAKLDFSIDDKFVEGYRHLWRIINNFVHSRVDYIRTRNFLRPSLATEAREA